MENDTSDVDNEENIALMQRIAARDSDAFTQLIHKYKDAIVGTISKMLGGYGDIEDIAQHVFIRVWKSAPQYEPTAKFTTWLFTITRNLVFNESRRISRKKCDSYEQQQETTGFEFTDTSTLSPADSLLERELQKSIDKAIATLPEKARMAIILRRYENMPYEDIAKVLNISVAAVKSLLFRARSQLKELLSNYLSE